jgi:GNAT superfamily N-acetyltransferase
MPEAKVTVLRGSAIRPQLLDIAALRMRIFREWPYCYDGTLDYERDYLSELASDQRSAVVLVSTAQRILGCSTCMPMESAHRAFKNAVRPLGVPLNQVCYFGESVLDSGWRGRGFGRQFFTIREQIAAELGRKLISFCAVERSEDDPRRPADFKSLEPMWTRFGYQKTDLICHFHWRELGNMDESEQQMRFWTKPL